MPNATRKKLSRFGRYLKKLKISTAGASVALGVTKSYVNALATGAMTPGLKLAIEIQRWSRGVVGADSWVK